MVENLREKHDLAQQFNSLCQVRGRSVGGVVCEVVSEELCEGCACVCSVCSCACMYTDEGWKISNCK